MKRRYFFILICIFSTYIFCGCASSEKLTAKGWQLYNAGNYSKAQSKFEKALDKKNLTRAFEGMAFVKYKYKDYSSAEKYIQKVYDRSKSSGATYNYACFTNLNGNSSKAMRLLYELGNLSDFETYRKLALKDVDLNSLRNNIKFSRYLSGYRRLKISPYELYSNDEDADGIFFHNENELFVTISNNNYLILSTKIQENKNHVFIDDYVVFDYPLGSTVQMTLMDEDIYDHDNLVSKSGSLLDMGDMNFSRNGFMKIRFEDTEEQPYTTGLFVPSERNLLKDLFVAAGASYGMTKLANLDKTFITRLVSCAGQYKVGTMISDPLKAAIVAEAVRKVIENQGSPSNIGVTTFTNYVASELRSNNQSQLANAVDAGVVMNCIFSK